MPKTPIDYSKSVIYKIEHIDKPELVYVGSTTDFIKRKYKHKSSCYNEKGKQYNIKLYQIIRKNGGFEEFKIMIICEFPCNSKIELIIEEEKYRKELQASLNSYRAFITNEEIIIYNKEYHEIYRDNNKEKTKEYLEEYYETNKGLIKEKAKEYYETNKGLIKEKAKEYYETNKEKAKEYYENNKEKLNEKIICNCGSIISKSNKLRHEKTIKHCQFIQQN